MMKAMVFAAGLGTRLRPLTDDRPKALVEVGGVPMMDRLLSRLEAQGFDDVVVNVHHFPDMMTSHLSSRWPGVKVSDERDALLETGGALRKAAPLLRGCGAFLAHNVDIFSDADLSAFRDAFLERDGDAPLALLMVTDRPSTRNLLFDSDMRLVGWRNNTTGEIRTPFPDLDPSSCRAYAFSGIHIISERILDLMDSWPERFSITDFYIASCATEPIYGYDATGRTVLDLGKIDALRTVESLL